MLLEQLFIVESHINTGEGMANGWFWHAKKFFFFFEGIGG